MGNTLTDLKRSFYMNQIPGATNQMTMTDLEELFFSNPSAYLKSSNFTEDEIGYKAWSYDPVIATGNSAQVAGTLYLSLMKLRKPASISNLVASVQAAGVTLTAGQCFAGLWRASDRTLIALTADQSASWTVVGKKVMPLVGGPYQLAAGDYYAGYWSNGTTGPGFTRHANAGNTLTNGELNAPNLRECTADVGLTNVAPSPLGVQSSNPSVPWSAMF